MGKPYKYHLRPGYGLDELLLEFFSGSSDAAFNDDLLAALQDISPKVDSIDYVWANDEVVFKISSNQKDFCLSKHIWGFAFITAENNQLAIKLIEQILSSSNLFEKVVVGFDKYKNIKN